MTPKIPSTIGLLSLSLAMSACSDAERASTTFEKVCKKQCECEATVALWNDIRNCKNACEGYATVLQSFIDDDSSEACGDLGKILDDIEACTDESCGPERDICLASQADELADCWDVFDGYYLWLPSTAEDPGAEGPSVRAVEVSQQMMTPIPGAIDASVMYSATHE